MKEERTEQVEHLELIARRSPPGDKWELTGNQGVTHASLTDALEAWFAAVGEPVSFRLDPLDSKLYAIRTEEVEIKPEPVKRYGIYGEYSQLPDNQ